MASIRTIRPLGPRGACPYLDLEPERTLNFLCSTGWLAEPAWKNGTNSSSKQMVVDADNQGVVVEDLPVHPDVWDTQHHYRCFIPAHSQSFALLPTGPWWLTVALLGTGFGLQWRYFRKKEALDSSREQTTSRGVL